MAVEKLKKNCLQIKEKFGLFNLEEIPINNELLLIDPHNGGKILQFFLNKWSEMHKLNEENAQSANGASQEIEKLTENLNSTKTNIELIIHTINSSNLSTNITQCLCKVDEIYETCKLIEEKLINMEFLIDELEFKNMEKKHKTLLFDYEKRKFDKLNEFENSLIEKYQIKLLEQDANKKHVLEERQKVFNEAFKNDLVVYKNSGTIPKVNVNTQTGAILEEIQLDYDENELENFFNNNN